MAEPLGLICTPLLAEGLALRGRLRAAHVRTGPGPTGHVPPHLAFSRPAITTSPGGNLDDDEHPVVHRPLLVAGVAGALSDDLRPGDLVVSDEVRTRGARYPSYAAPLVAGALRRLGLSVHVGPVYSSDHVVRAHHERRELRERLAEQALAVDTESAFLTARAPSGQTVAVRAVVDTPSLPLLRPGTAWRGVGALRSLRSAAPALEAWAAATGEREVLLAAPRSFCAGVERAIEIVERALERHGAPVYVRRQIVHNRHVVSELERRGAVFVTELDEVPYGSVAVLAAHGVAPSVRQQAVERRLQVVDATCPLVAKVHHEVRRFASRDSTVFLIGHEEHEEVVGTRGEAPSNVVVVADPDAASRVDVRDPEHVSYVMQTTLAVDEAEQTAAVLRQRFPALSAPRKDDICYATTNRQLAVRAIARESDLVLVLGSQNSSNSHRLAEVAEAEGAPSYLVDDASDVDLRWLAGARRVGITAGASAPSRLVDDLVRCLSGLGPVRVRETQVVDEDVRFTLPREVS
ncbi:MAG TPA: 4-hydroxy-3-methylbut-2-enyl diphosphate reductase [Actinomycetales bacterium]|nr:4-hydroxy-3-methylbut-2-enyl diphosphate reductase [Actinomycetales bacterium]